MYYSYYHRLHDLSGLLKAIETPLNNSEIIQLIQDHKPPSFLSFWASKAETPSLLSNKLEELLEKAVAFRLLDVDEYNHYQLSQSARQSLEQDNFQQYLTARIATYVQNSLPKTNLTSFVTV